MSQVYVRVRSKETARLLDGFTRRLGVEYGDGSTGITDVRFINLHGYYRRITGEACQRILSYCRLEKIPLDHGGAGRVCDDIFDRVPLAVLEELDPQEDNPNRTF